jgi:mono/diheme cytochrome c family protein
MQRRCIAVSACIGFALAAVAALHAAGGRDAIGPATSETFSAPMLRAHRSSPLDLEIGGDVRGLPPGATRYRTRGDLLALPQVTYVVEDDSNFTRPTKVSGVPLDELERSLAGKPDSDLVVAICDDLYRANYPRSYIKAHHPLLVLKINGEPPSSWPKDSETHRYDMGPYMISNPKFTPSFKILAHADEPQNSWGVVRIEFHDEKQVFGAIAPRGPHASDPALQSGYRIAEQNCFRCHNMGKEGGQKSGLSWVALSAIANAVPDLFGAYVRDPHAKNPQSQMPGRPDYDDATIRALTEYFQTFSRQEKP